MNALYHTVICGLSGSTVFFSHYVNKGTIFREEKLFSMKWVLCAFFWVIPRRLKFICRRFGTLCLWRQVGEKNELGLKNVGVFIREKVWLQNSLSQMAQAIYEANLFPYKYPNIYQT